jgi:hypothetical protein
LWKARSEQPTGSGRAFFILFTGLRHRRLVDWTVRTRRMVWVPILVTLTGLLLVMRARSYKPVMSTRPGPRGEPETHMAFYGLGIFLLALGSVLGVVTSLTLIF